jgi:hypothetical protein
MMLLRHDSLFIPRSQKIVWKPEASCLTIGQPEQLPGPQEPASFARSGDHPPGRSHE